MMSLGIDLVRWYRLDGPDSPEQVGEFYAELALRMVLATRPGDQPDDGSGRAPNSTTSSSSASSSPIANGAGSTAIQRLTAEK
jgi:hypothetical protein